MFSYDLTINDACEMGTGTSFRVEKHISTFKPFAIDGLFVLTGAYNLCRKRYALVVGKIFLYMGITFSYKR